MTSSPSPGEALQGGRQHTEIRIGDPHGIDSSSGRDSGLTEPLLRGASEHATLPVASEERKTIRGAQFIITQYKETGSGPQPVPNMPQYTDLAPHKKPSSRPPAVASPAASVTTLCNTAVGAGVLAFPFAFRMAGVFGGLLLCALLCALEGFSLYVLCKFSERHNAQTYASLINSTLGKKLSAILTVVMNLYAFGSCSAYMIILGDYLSSWAQDFFGAQTPYTDRKTMIIAWGFAFMLPLCLARRLNALAVFSSTSLLAFVFMAFVVAKEGYEGFHERPEPFADLKWFKVDTDFLYAIPIIAFGFNCHVNAIPVFQELSARPAQWLGVDEKARTTQSHKLNNMIRVCVVAFTIVLVGYLSVGVSGYLGYPGTRSNLFDALPQTLLTQAAKVVVSFIVSINYPLTHFPSRESGLELLAMMGWEGASQSPLAFIIYAFVYVSGTVAVGVAVTDLGLVLNIIGGTASSFILFFNPGLLLINSAIQKDCTFKLDSLSKSLANSQVGFRIGSRMGSRKGSRTSLPGWALVAHKLEVEERARRLLSDYPLLSELNEEELEEPLLWQLGRDEGIKKTGLVCSPRWDWTVGMFLVLCSVCMSCITVYTTLVKTSAV